MDLASATHELYAASPDDFVERRTALVAQARAAKDRPLATAIGQLRKPTRVAWLVNVYARLAADELGSLLDLGEALQAAQEQLSATDLRRLSEQRRTMLAAATRRAVTLGESAGYTATEAVRQEVTQTLQAALADPEVAAQVRAGVVTQAQAYGGFGPMTFAPAAAQRAADEVPAEPIRDETDETDETAAAAEEAQEAAAAAEQRLHDAEAELSRAAEAAETATSTADELSAAVEALRRQLTEAEAAADEAAGRARAASGRVTELDRAVREARAAYEAL